MHHLYVNYLLGHPVKRKLLRDGNRNTPKSASISKSKKLTKKTPKPLWSEVVKKTVVKKAMLQPKARKAQTVISKMKRPAKFNPRVQEVSVLNVKSVFNLKRRSIALLSVKLFSIPNCFILLHAEKNY